VVLCLISLFTVLHIFWVAALLLALIDIPILAARFAGLRDQSRRWPASDNAISLAKGRRRPLAVMNITRA